MVVERRLFSVLAAFFLAAPAAVVFFGQAVRGNQPRNGGLKTAADLREGP
ncbi:MAG: hypothetical protein K6U03_00265 [Firmicutes bacterium]|nr:hypothetical protein [Bacillota bacterium]